MGTNVIQWSNLDDQVRYQPIPWTPAKITTVLWLDAADISTITEVTGVSIWADKSTVGTNDAVQADTAKQVTLDGKYIKGIADRNGTMSITNTPTVLSCISVVKLQDDASAVAFMQLGASSGNSAEFFVRDASTTISFDGVGSAQGKYRLNGGTISGFAENHIEAGVENATFIIEGVYQSSIVIDKIIGRGAGEGASENCFVGEIIWFASETSTDDRQLVEGYLAWKWDAINGDTALVTALPAGHPYKSLAPTI